jgi:hypothetical protein
LTSPRGTRVGILENSPLPFVIRRFWPPAPADALEVPGGSRHVSWLGCLECRGFRAAGVPR